MLQKKNFNPLARLNVKFAGEDGYDAGVLRREFMRLVLAAIRSYAIFDGAENAARCVLGTKSEGIDI